VKTINKSIDKMKRSEVRESGSLNDVGDDFNRRPVSDAGSDDVVLEKSRSYKKGELFKHQNLSSLPARKGGYGDSKVDKSKDTKKSNIFGDLEELEDLI
jgi:hypothetical protein